MAATVLLPATFVVLHAEGLFLAVADGAQPVCRNSERDKVLLHGAGAAIAVAQIVFGGAALVAVSFDGHLNLRVVLQEIRGFRERLAGIGTNVRFVVIEIGIAHFLQEELIEGGLRGRHRRRRRRIYSDARAGGGGATFFGPQPKVKTAAASAVSKLARQSEREARFMRFLLNILNIGIPVFVPPGPLS